jgi:hypothetical protein
VVAVGDVVGGGDDKRGGNEEDGVGACARAGQEEAEVDPGAVLDDVCSWL